MNAESAKPTDSCDSLQSESEAEIHRVGRILESVAARFPPDSEEALAIRDAALAFAQVQLHDGLKRAYAKLRAAFNGELTEEMQADLRRHGIDPDGLDAEIGDE